MWNSSDLLQKLRGGHTDGMVIPCSKIKFHLELQNKAHVQEDTFEPHPSGDVILLEGQNESFKEHIT